MTAPADAAAAPAAPLWRIAAALFTAGFASFSLLYCVQPLLPDLARDFRLDPATASLALSSSTAALALSIVAVGALAEGWDRRWVMFASVAGAALLDLACAAAPGWAALVALRTLEGLVLGGAPGLAMTYVAEEVPPARLGLAMGLSVSGNAFGGMTGRVAMGMLAQATSWRVAIGALGAVDLAAALLFFALLPAPRHFVRRPGLPLAAHLAAWRGHLASPALALLFAVGFLAMGAFVTVYNYVGFRLAAPPYGLTPGQIGLIFLCYLIGMVASSWAGSLADRFGRAPVLAAGALIGLAGLALTLAAPLVAVIAGVATLTAGFFVAHSVASGWVGRRALADRSHASALYLLAYYAGGSVMGSAGGLVWRAAGWNAVAAWCGAQMLAILAIAAALGRSERSGRYSGSRAKGGSA